MNFSLITLIIGCLFSSNIILSQFWGICPFLGISKKPQNAIGMGGALIFVVTMSAIICYALEMFVLQPLGLDYLQILVFILVIASFVQFVEFFMKKFMKSLYKALGIYLPLITTNCVVLFVAQTVAGYTATRSGIVFNYTFLDCILYAILTAVGYTLVLTLLSFMRVRIDNQEMPTPMKGNAIILVTAALMVLAFKAFAGLV